MTKDEIKNIETTDLTDQLTVVILEQSLLHWRHIENLRQGFTTVWAAIVAGVLAFISQTPNFLVNTAPVPALIFLIILTVLGLLMSMRLSYNIKPCEENIEEVLKKAKLEKYSLMRGWQKGITKHFRLRRIYSWTYFVALVFLIVLLILTVSGSLNGINS